MRVPVELKEKYLNRRIFDIHKVRTSLEQDDYSLAAKLGHQVKGNAVTFDFPQLAFVGMEIEKAAKKKDKEGINLLMLKMESTIRLAQNKIQLKRPEQFALIEGKISPKESGPYAPFP